MTDPIELPLIDLTSSDLDAAGKAMLDAAVRFGFLYIDSRTTVFSSTDVDRTFGMVCLCARNFHQIQFHDNQKFQYCSLRWNVIVNEHTGEVE